MTRKARELPSFLKVPWGIRSALLLLFMAMFAIPFGFSLYLELFSSFSPGLHWLSRGLYNGDVVANFIFTAVYSLLGLFTIWLFARHYQAGWRTLGWRKFNFWKMLAFVIATFIIFIFLAAFTIWLVHILVPAFDPNQAQNNEFTTPGASKFPLIVFFSIVVFPPVLEETLFRGYLFPAFSRRLGVIWGAVISSILFAVAHMQFNVGIYTFVLGLLLCFMYLKLKSIIPGVLLHAVNNSMALLAIIKLH
jgi:membrane protease YdiL (CAAX protease family)